DPPDTVLTLLEAAAIKAVPTGIAHGTITAVVPPRHFEITTLRRDVENFGRRARVAFTDDWAADAARRDFTMNALFLDATGRVFDPVGGLADLRAGRVRFVGDAAARIREDVLRLLRFYRFHAHYRRGGAARLPRARRAAARPVGRAGRRRAPQAACRARPDADDRSDGGGWRARRAAAGGAAARSSGRARRARGCGRSAAPPRRPAGRRCGRAAGR